MAIATLIRVVASYTVLAATGALSPQVLALKIEVYDPVTHYQQVRDVWGGVRTPEDADAELENLGTIASCRVFSAAVGH